MASRSCRLAAVWRARATVPARAARARAADADVDDELVERDGVAAAGFVVLEDFAVVEGLAVFEGEVDFGAVAFAGVDVGAVPAAWA